LKLGRLTVPLAGLCLVALVSASCGGSESSAATSTPRPPAAIELPTVMLGLNVGREDIASRVTQSEQPYVDSVGLFAFRRGKDVLEATLQVSRFTPEARPESADFRGSIISRIGGASPRQIRIGEQRLFLTSGRNQIVFIWFKKRGFFVLTVRRDYAFPRTLARRLIDMNLSV
jgi:hypothetical protein